METLPPQGEDWGETVHCGGQQVFWGVTSTQCDKPLWYDPSSHSPTLSFHLLRQLSEDPGPGTTTGKDGDRVDSASHSFSLHHFTLISPVLSSVPFLSSFFLRLQALAAHFVTTGLLPGSRPDIRHMSPCRPWPHCLKPDVVWGFNWRTTVTHSQQPFLCLILYLLQWWKKPLDPLLD